MSKNHQLREDIIQYYHWLRAYGYNDSHSGNISARDHDSILVSPSGACADTLKTADLLPFSINSAIPEGASLDSRLHQKVYQHYPGAGAVLHSHGAYTVAMTMNGEDFIPPDFEGAYYFKRVPVINLDYTDVISAAPEHVVEQLQHSNIVVVRGHGVYAMGETLNLAYKWTCSLELSAKTAFIAKQAGTL